MKRSSGDKSNAIEISDDESPQQPPQKTVKKEVEQLTSESILGTHQHVVKLEKNYQEARRQAAEARKRVAFLENLLDKKQEASEDTEKEELKKKLTEISTKLEEATRKETDLQKKIAETSAELEKEKTDSANREEQLKRLAKLEKDYQGVCRIANEYERGMNEAKERVHVLENIIGLSENSMRLFTPS